MHVHLAAKRLQIKSFLRSRHLPSITEDALRLSVPHARHRTTMTDDRERWNAKFLAGEAQSVEPDPLLLEVCPDTTPGRALDLAGGAGRHALWLAQRGWDVVLSDISDEGLAIAASRATESGVTLALRRESAAETLVWASANEPFDLIVVFWCLLRDHFPALPGLLAPSGLLVYK